MTLSSATLHQPLKGIRVIEFSTMVTASLATMMMAAQGADVIKVEPVGIGDPMRFIGSQKQGISALFANCNRGKRALAVDLKGPRGQEMVQRLSAQADAAGPQFMKTLVADKITAYTACQQGITAALLARATTGEGRHIDLPCCNRASSFCGPMV